MSSALLCLARRIITAVISFDISSSLRSSRDFSYWMLVSLRISIAPGPLPVTPGMKGLVDHSSALLRGRVAGYITRPFLILRSCVSLTICWLIFDIVDSCRSPIIPIIANGARSWLFCDIAFEKR